MISLIISIDLMISSNNCISNINCGDNSEYGITYNPWNDVIYIFMSYNINSSL